MDKEKTEVLLINPPYPVLEKPFQEHLGLGYLTSFLRQNGVGTSIIDANLSQLNLRQTTTKALELNPFLIGISVTYQDSFKYAAKLASLLKNKGYRGKIVIGGIFPTLVSQEILQNFPQIDIIVRGEGEETLFELYQVLKEEAELKNIDGIAYRENGKIFVNQSRKLVENLDFFPDPSRDTLPLAIKHGGCISISSSRGCFGSCSFCSIYSFYKTLPGKNYRYRSIERVLDEIERLVKETGEHKVMFVDAEFIGPGKQGKERAINLAEGIVKRGLKIRFRIEARADNIDEEVLKALKAAGLAYVFLGVESGIQTALDRFNKSTTVEDNLKAIHLLKKLEIPTGIGFIMFDPYTTLSEVIENAEFLENTGIPYNQLAVTVSPAAKLIVFAGTEAQKKLIKEGVLKGNYLSYRYKIPDFKARLIQKLFEFLVKLRMSLYKLEVLLKLKKPPELEF